MDILGYSSYGWLPSVLYLALLLVVSFKAKSSVGSGLSRALVQAAIFVILVIHGVQLHDSVFTPQGFVFGFAQDLSLIAWVGLAFYWFQSWFLPISSLRWMALMFALVCAFLPNLFPGVLISPKAVSDPWFKGHFVVATVAVGLLSLAAMHAMLMSVQDRALHRQADVVIALANALGEGLREGGMGTCGKHYPGHGFVIPDSHVELPVDNRPLDEMQDDIQPYRQVALDGVMAAHVIYDCVDCNTAVFSNKWINYLRNDINFNGVVFTDDLSMEGAGVVGNMLNRVDTAYRAGCDMMIVSHSPEGVALVLKEWQPALQDEHRQRVEALIPEKAAMNWAQLQAQPRYQAAVQHIASLVA